MKAVGKENISLDRRVVSVVCCLFDESIKRDDLINTRIWAGVNNALKYLAWFIYP